jgi:hypothetical protein
VLVAWVPDSADLRQAFAALPASVVYFLDLCAVPQGLSMILPAYATRFAIRRVPLLG